MSYAYVVFYQILVMLVFCGIGIVYQILRPLSKEQVSAISGIVVTVLSPGLILSGATKDYSSLSNRAFVMAACIGFGSYLALLGIGYLLGCLFHRDDRNKHMIYSMMCTLGNVGFFGIPLVNAAFGPEQALYLYFFVVPNNCMLFSFGYMFTSAMQTGQMRLDPRRLLNPGTISCAVVIICMLFRVQLPDFPAKIVTFLTTASTPMGMFSVGIALFRVDWKKALTNVRLMAFLLIRQLLIPLGAGLILRLFVTDPVLLGTSIIMLALPIGNATVLLTDGAQLESAPATEGVAVSTVASVATIPLLMAILT
ncbi:MAG: AEC family transporter [Oscillospiraceae bacterium]|nr:AEC family transporter [Oscillospiraceae bacterium]